MKGRTAPPKPRGPERPAEWGPWEWRSHVTNPRNHRVREGVARGIVAPAGLKNACVNAVFSVMFFEVASEWGTIEHLMIRRHDMGTIVTWAEKQRIKDELIGPHRTAIEVYPAAADLVDDAPIYHLWVLPEAVRLPFGLHIKD